MGAEDGEEFCFAIFASVHIIDILVSERIYAMDATFHIVPVGCFQQILIISVVYIDHVSNKSQLL